MLRFVTLLLRFCRVFVMLSMGWIGYHNNQRSAFCSSECEQLLKTMYVAWPVASPL